MRRARWVALGIAVLLIACAGGCSRGGPPNLILISVDTLRPDHLGYNGYPRKTSPAIDRLASEGVVFTDATSVSGWTLPSMATILTGQYPKDHGATDFFWSLDPKITTLADVLRKHGYDTFGFVSHIMLTPTYGMGEGFDHYDFSVLNSGHPHNISTSEPLTNLTLKGLRDAKAPWFIWVHYFDPHFMYLDHPRFHFGDSDLDRYDSEIAYTDYYIDNLLRAVDRGNTVIVFIADHGEEFGEHGGKYHYTLHGEVLRIPMIIKAPGIKPRKDNEPAEQTDVMPTVLGLLGIPAPPGLPGRDLFKTTAPPDKPMYIERDRPPQWHQRGIIRGNLKLFVVEDADTTLVPPADRAEEIPVTNVHPGIYLYDMARDPGEHTNLFSPSDSTSLKLLGQVKEHFAHAKAHPAPVEVDADLLQKLRSLGYVK